MKKIYNKRGRYTYLGTRNPNLSKHSEGRLPTRVFQHTNESQVLGQYTTTDDKGNTVTYTDYRNTKWVDPTLVTLAEWLRPLPVVRKKIYSLRAIYCKWRNGYGKS